MAQPRINRGRIQLNPRLDMTGLLPNATKANDVTTSS